MTFRPNGATLLDDNEMFLDSREDKEAAEEMCDSFAGFLRMHELTMTHGVYVKRIGPNHFWIILREY